MKAHLLTSARQEGNGWLAYLPCWRHTNASKHLTSRSSPTLCLKSWSVASVLNVSLRIFGNMELASRELCALGQSTVSVPQAGNLRKIEVCVCFHQWMNSTRSLGWYDMQSKQ